MPSDPTRDGYTFLGWFDQADGTGMKLEDNPTIPLSGDEQWYAGWTKNTGTIKLDANEGLFDQDGGDSDQSVETVSLMASDAVTEVDVMAEYQTNVAYEVPKRDSYAFVGWVKDKDDENEIPVYKIEMNSDSDGSTYYAKWMPNTTSVAFVATDADNADSSNIVLTGTYGETFSVPSDPVKSGYSFVGWFTSSTGGVKLDKRAGDEMTFSELDPSAYYARFTNDTIEVTLDANGGTIDGQESAVKSGLTDKTIDYSVPVRDGYTFVGWNASGNLDGDGASASISITYPAMNSVYKACWKANEASVKFIAAGGDVVDGGISTGKVNVDYVGKTDEQSTFSAVSATRVGYTFNGWSRTQVGGSIEALPTAFEPGQVVYYAQFTANDVHITLDGNGGSFAGIDPLQLTGKYDDNAVLERPTREGYTFVGWADREDAKPSEAKTGLTYGYGIATDGATIFAIWEANNIVVKYNAGKGQFADGTNEQQVSGGAETTYTIPDAPTRTGYDFKGWFTLPNGEGSDVSDVNTFPALKNAIYYAKWEKKTYEVKLDANGGTFGSDDTNVASGLYEEPVEYSVPTNNGYAFLGWSEDKTAAKDNATLQLVFDEDTKDKTFYAIWDPSSKGVVFIADGEDSHTSETITGKIGDEFEVPQDPVRAGYVFEGWYTEHKGGEKLDAKVGDKLTFSANTPVAYYAHFTEDKTDVALHYNTGNATDDETVSGLQGEQIAYKEVKRAGYTFKGWASTEVSSEADLGMRPTFAAKPQDGSAIDLYAVWSADEVTMTFSAQGGVFSDNKEIKLVNSVSDADYDLPHNPTRTGFTFGGWYTSTNGQGDLIDENSKAPTANTVYFAKWVGNKTEIVLDPNGGRFAEDKAAPATINALNETKSGEYLAPVEYSIPTREGYTFIGWNTSGESSDEADSPKMSITYPSSMTTYKACWRANDAKVIFIASKGDVVDSGKSSGKVLNTLARLTAM